MSKDIIAGIEEKISFTQRKLSSYFPTVPKHIAPVLNIVKRFAGEEPTNYVTKQYNNAMREILPKYGIEFKVFKRREFDGIPISAATVRKLIKDGKYENIKNLVPESTYEFLVSRDSG